MTIKHIEIEKIDAISVFHSLTIEGNLNVSNIFFEFKRLFLEEYGMLIIAADGTVATVMNKLSKQFEENGISHKIIKNYYLWIENAFIEKVFTNSDFGGSMDICAFMKKMPSEFTHLNGNKGQLPRSFNEQRRFLNFITADFSENDILLSYYSIPDLIVQSKNELIIKKIFSHYNENN